MDKIKEAMSEFVVKNTDNKDVMNFLLNQIDETYYEIEKHDIYKFIENSMKGMKSTIKNKELIITVNGVDHEVYIDEMYFEEITKFLKFYVKAYFEVYLGDEYNLKEVAVELFEFSEEVKEEFGEEITGKQYPEWISEDKEFDKFYDKMCRDHFKSDMLPKMGKEAGVKISKLNNYKGKKIFKHSLREMKDLNKMWRRESDDVLEAEKAHKKIRNNIIYKMTNKNFHKLNEYFENEINNSNEKFKNIYYYKLEKKSGYELKKCIFKNLNKLKNRQDKIEYCLTAIKYIVPISVLTIRENLTDRLLDVYNSNCNYKLDDFELEMLMLKLVIGHQMKRISKYINSVLSKVPIFTDDEVKEFEKIYNKCNGKKEFSNTYKINKDYNKDDVELYASVAQILMESQIEMIKENVKLKNKEINIDDCEEIEV